MNKSPPYPNQKDQVWRLASLFKFSYAILVDMSWRFQRATICSKYNQGSWMETLKHAHLQGVCI